MAKTICTYLALLICLVINAQSNDRFTAYGVNEGLSQSSIDDIIQDGNGFLWTGTAGGLNRFDGYQFKIYKQSSVDPKAISSDRGFHFYNDRSGRLWIASYNGISLYNENTDNFNNLLIYAPKNTITIENHFFGEDDTYIWIGLCNYGIVKVDKQTLKVYNTSFTASLLHPGINAWYHGFIENGKLWIVDNNESAKSVFSLYDIKTQKKDTVQLALNDIINMNDSEALGMNTKTAFLINKKTFAYKTIDLTQNGVERNILSMHRESPTEVLLCSSTKGIFYLDTHNGMIIKHISITDPENKKSFLLALCAYTDRSGNTWIGSRGEGLQKLPFPHKKFKWYHSDSSNNNVFSIYADSAKVYIGYIGHGIDIFERNKGFIKNIAVNRQIKTIVNNAYTITPFGNDKLLVIGNNAKSNLNNVPFSFINATGKVAPLNNEVQKVFSTYWGRGNLRHFIFKDIDGTYLTNIGEYLVRLTVCGKDSFCPQLVYRFPGETLSNCFRGSDGTLWIGTYSGIYYQNKKNWERISLPKNVEIKTINEDPAGNTWLGTSFEIYVLNKTTHKIIQHHTEENGLVNGHLYGILRDEDGNMWFSHNKGLSVYRWKEKKFNHYGKEDGLQSSEFNAGAYFKAADGELFFGGINGVTSFYPREILRNLNTPAVNITGIKLFDEPYQSDMAYWNMRKIELPYTENSISFEFALPEYTNQLKNTYQFTMEGVDHKWINAGDRRFTRYAGLRPGHYTFKVKGANNDGVFGKDTEVAIIIIPPFWQRSWFIVLLILAFILLSISTGIYIQKYRQKKEIRALELQHKIQLERERISRDLHDNVGTQLSLISKNIEGVIHPLQNVSDAERIKNLSSISQTSKEVIFTLRETIWALNREEISLEELSDKLKGFTQKLFEINATCRLLYSEDIDGNAVVLSPSEAIHLFRICQEAITNSLKYANAATMHITINSKDGKYKIIIADDGIGFEKDIKKASAHYGLENMKYRAQEIGCDFLIDSMPRKGTSISITKK